MGARLKGSHDDASAVPQLLELKVDFDRAAHRVAGRARAGLEHDRVDRGEAQPRADDLSRRHRRSHRRAVSACEAPPPRPFCKPLGPPAPLVTIPLEVVQGPTQLVVAGPDFAEELLNG